ncbi:pseudouridine synthase [Jannaschia aquimarina]|uniref:Pseudouridine synthase n=1 Tax=Jannaschia aquimarina TaxID=935700 RepID=A0A0D1EL66_9RHOB|nr:pseudouridine synthase [Jannaschia aquimarina]KIT17716.1 Ribosomal large subunit pseudouridine synthase B [Jannaschia aquimarina]SNS78296.1 23S rRNA pseudouridine2605 synthase [Jannaschia aquimarina]
MTKPPHRGADAQRIAKRIARAGVASRRDAEEMIRAGRVAVNGTKIDDPALNVIDSDRIEIDGDVLPDPEPTRLWLYHKPVGLVTTERDEKGRETVFDALRDKLGRVLSVGRLDLTSEGLLLLTNDGELKRRLELPETGWLRRYRVRVNGTPDEAALQRLRDGIEIDGEAFAPMQAALDRVQGANAWLTVGLREGRNREVRRAMEAVGLIVSRLIRVSYGPFQLGHLKPGETDEIKPRVLRDQLGGLWQGELPEGRRDGPKAMSGDRKDGGRRGGGKPDGKGSRGRDGQRERPARDDASFGKRPGKPRREDADAGRDGGKRRPRPAGDRLVDQGRGGPERPRGDKPSGPRADRARGHAGAKGGPRTAKPPVTRNDGDGSRPAKPKGDERQAALRGDPSASLRKGGKRGGPKRTMPRGGPSGGKGGPQKGPKRGR